MNKKYIFLLSLFIQIFPKTDEIDYYILALIWPAGHCYQETNCKKHIPNDFTIHGLWPKNKYGKDPKHRQKIDFKQTKLNQMLLSDMKKYWPTLVKYIRSKDFWSHEWYFHGAFTNFTAKEYFSKTINFYKKNIKGKIKDKLAKNGIVPSNHKTYTYKQIVKALGPNIKINCKKNKNNKTILSSINIYIHKDLNKILDYPIKRFKSSCTSEDKIIFPYKQEIDYEFY